MNPNSQAKVVVATPVYNGEKHLAHCIESVLAQTYRNFEYLIINNCSTDRTLEIAERYAQQDERVRVVSNEKLLDVVASHNRAFSLTLDSDYVRIVGADNWLCPRCIEELLKVAEEHPSVGMVTSYVLVGTQIEWTGLPYPSTVVPGREMCRMRLIDGVRVFGGPSASLIRTTVVKNQQPFYTPDYYHGDNEAYLELLGTWDFGFVHQVLSYNRRDVDSRTTHYLRSFNSNILAEVEELLKFGPRYLTSDELDMRLRQAKSKYYNFLARSVIARRRNEFWQAHRARLARANLPFDRWLLARLVVRRLFNLLLNPKRSIDLWTASLRERAAERRVDSTQEASTSASARAASSQSKRRAKRRMASESNDLPRMRSIAALNPSAVSTEYNSPTASGTTSINAPLAGATTGRPNDSASIAAPDVKTSL